MGQGDCGACICDVFPQACQEKEEMKESLRKSDIKEKDQQPMSLNEPLLQPRLGCGLPEILACSGDILGESQVFFDNFLDFLPLQML